MSDLDHDQNGRGPEDRPIKILAVHNRYQQPGGEDHSHAAEMKLTREHGHTVDEYLEDNARIEELGRLRTACRTVWSPETYRRVRRRLKGGGYDVVHIQNFFPLISPSVYYAARAEGVAVVQALRNYRLICPSATLYRSGKICEQCCGKTFAWPGIVHRCYRGSAIASATVAAMLTVHRVLRTWSRVVDAYVAPTVFVRDKMVAGGLPAGKVFIKPNLIFQAIVNTPPPRSPSHRPHIVFVGRLTIEKGLNVLLDAVEILGGKVALKIVGDGPIRDEVAKRAGELDGVEMMGSQPQERVQEIVKHAACLVAPAQWYEPFGRTMVEALAQGVPVIASDQPPTRDIVRDGRNGFLFDPSDPRDLAQKIERLCEDSARLAQMKAYCRQDYDARFSADHNYRILMGIYRAAMRNRDRYGPRGHHPDQPHAL